MFQACFGLTNQLDFKKIIAILKKMNPIFRQLIRMTWGSRFQLEMLKGSLVFVIGTFDDHHLQERVSLGCGFLNKMLTTI